MLRILLCLMLAAALALPAMAEDTKDEAVFDLLLIGTDATTEEETGRSDAMVLLRLDAEAGKIRVVSFLRDLYVRIPGHGRNRLNAAYAFGGAELLLATLEENFGVTADAYAEVNFARLTKVIDRIGGVEAEVSEAERRHLNGILRHYNRAIGVQESDGLLAAAGLVNLTGKQALCYSRIRKIDDDFQRTSRQREVLEAAFRKVAALDVWSLAVLALENLDAVKTNLSAWEVLRLLPMAVRARNAAFSAMTVPVEGAWQDKTVDGMQVLAVEESPTRAAIRAFLDGK